MLRIADGAQVWDYSFDQRKQVFQEDMVYTIRGLSSILQAQMDVVVNQIDSLFYTMQMGKREGITSFKEPSDKKPEVKSEDLDETDFEIIPEKKLRQEEK